MRIPTPIDAGVLPRRAAARRRPDWTGGLVAPRHRQRDYWRRRLLVAADCAGIVAAFALAAAIVPGGWSPAQLGWVVLSLPLWVLLFNGYTLYSRELGRISHSSVDDIPWLFHASLVGTLLIWPFMRLLAGSSGRVEECVLFGLFALVSVLLMRTAVRRAAQTLIPPERALLVAEHDLRSALVRKIQGHPEYAIDAIGALATGEGDEPDDVPILGSLGDLERVARERGIERVLLSSAAVEPQGQVEMLRRCRHLGLKVSLLPQVFDAMGPSVEVDDFEGITVLGLNPPVLSRSSRAMKRATDLVGASLLLAFVAPLTVLAAIAIKLDSPGPVFFRQKRIGKGGTPFRVLKFRTMYADADARVDELRKLSKDPNWLHLEHDPRITRVGRLLRMTSVDELPQLWNVVRGEMSLVGPRPLIESEDQMVDGWGRSRLELTPGITGFWQVLGRTSIPFDEMVKLDYLYVANWSVWGDVRLILRTLPAVLSQRGAN